ncbi:ArnT family glycosyltransferase [Lutibacter sp.]
MLNFAQKNPLVTISIVVLLMLLIHLDVPNITIMEARNFITARELLQNNDWLLTTMNGEARYQKPPLPTWLTALSGISFGIQSLFALRLPGVLMVLLLAFSLYFLSLKLKLSKIHSLHNSLILVTSFYVIAIINEAPWDIYTHAFMLTALYFLFQVLESDKVIWKQLIYSAFFVGCSIMSKGPVSLYALFLPFLISYGITFKFRN